MDMPFDAFSDVADEALLVLFANGDRVALTARGEVFIASATKGERLVRVARRSDVRYREARFDEDGEHVIAMSDESGENMQGVGLIVYRADSLEEAQELAKADPMHASGARSYVMRRWLINEGSLTLGVGLSTGRVTLK